MIKVAIVGTGAISDSHIQAYLRFRDRCKIVAVADLQVEKARTKAAQYGLNVPVFKTAHDMISGVEFDLASVCLPPFEHAPASVALFEAGKHVLVEKPMAPSLAECDAMIEASRKSGRLLSVVAQNRFKTAVQRLKRVLDSGIAGRILHAQVDSFWWRGSRYYDLWWRGTWEKEGGGCTINHAVHQIDLFLWMRGVPRQVDAFMANLNHDNSEVEDFSTALLVYPDGGVGQITASLVHHGEEQQIVFQGEHARVGIPWRVCASRQRDNGFPEENARLAGEIQALHDSLPPLRFEGHDGQVLNMLAAIEGGERLLIDGVEGRRPIELITAIYQSAHLGAKVEIPLPESAPFYTREGILKNAHRFHQKTRSVESFRDNRITFGRDYGA